MPMSSYFGCRRFGHTATQHGEQQPDSFVGYCSFSVEEPVVKQMICQVSVCFFAAFPLHPKQRS